MKHRDKQNLKMAALELASLLVGLLLIGSAFVIINVLLAIR